MTYGNNGDYRQSYGINDQPRISQQPSRLSNTSNTFNQTPNFVSERPPSTSLPPLPPPLPFRTSTQPEQLRTSTQSNLPQRISNQSIQPPEYSNYNFNDQNIYNQPNRVSYDSRGSFG